MCFKTGIQYQRNSVNMGIVTLILFKPIETHVFCSHDLSRKVNYTDRVSRLES